MTCKIKTKQLRWLAATIMLVAAMVMPSAAWAEGSTVTFTAKEGTAGFSDSESFDELIDGKYTEDGGTKWCLTFPSDGAYIIFSASEAISVTGYSIVTGNDNASYEGRNPQSWKLYGCNDASAGKDSESWVLIDEVTNDTKLENKNYQKYDFTLSNTTSQKYQYFKMEITATKGATVLQMSELILAYIACNHQWVKTNDVVAPTCTEGGYDVYQCSVCQLKKNEANENGALGHQWVDGTVVAPTCTKDGYTPQTCSRCHAEQIINIVNATGHQWGNDDVCDVCQINNTVLNIPQGDGTLANPYKISTAGELFWFAGLVNGDASVCDYNETEKPTGTKQNTAACAVLIADITVNSNLLANLNEDGTVKDGYTVANWKPIGNSDKKFTGTFDGKGHTFSGLYFNDTNTEYVGLFGFNQGTIKNVGVVDSYFKGNKYVGGVCGYNKADEYAFRATDTSTTATITNCYNTSSVSGYDYVGGVCGYNHGYMYGYATTATITNCYNTGSVSGNDYIGGVCGYNRGNTYGGTVIATTTDCYNTGSVSGNNYIGGVCGSNEATSTYGGASAIISNCHNTGSVSGSESVGGVCGYNKADAYYETAIATATITDCYFCSTTYSGDAVGGNTDGTISNVESKSTAQFNSGEVCYLLNGSSPYGEWGQQIGTDGYPLIGSAYKVLRAAQDGMEGTNYWATFSNLDSNAELIDPKGDITVYNATVSDGTLTLAKRDDNKVSLGEGVLLKANSEYVNAKNISDEVSATTEENHLVATPATAQTITAETGYTLYRLTYNKVESKVGLGFYLGIVGDSKDGSKLAATPGKAYLKVETTAVTQPSGAPARSFAFPGDDGGTTGIGDIVIKGDAGINGSADGDGSIYDLQGRKVSKPAKGVYIKNNRVVFKLKN